jgi:high-affinity iron transporter
MGRAFLITLREGLEIGLVVAILFRYVLRPGREQLTRSLAAGSISAGLVSAISAVVFFNVVGDFEGKTEQVIEFLLALAACITLTWMIFWMRAHSRELSGSITSKLDAASTKSGLAIGLVAFAAVAREGFEAALLIVAGKVQDTKGTAVAVGGLIGLIVAAALSYAFFKGSTRLNLKKFFTVTGVILLFVAAGLFAKAAHEGREILGIEGWSATSMWNVVKGPFASGWISDFMQGMFGWSPSVERIQLLAYCLYLGPVAYFFLRRPKKAITNKVPATA